MSRPTRRTRAAAAPTRRGGTPIWVWVIYVLGIFAATIIVASILFTAGAFLLSNDVPVELNFSAPAVALWGGLVLLAAGTWLWRRRQGRRP